MNGGGDKNGSSQKATDTVVDEEPTDQESESAGQTGRWVGHMYLMTQTGEPATDHSGITVTLTAATSLASAGVSSLPASVQTDASGKFVLPDMVTGLYTISFSKENYGTMHYYNMSFTGGGDQAWAPYGHLRLYTGLTPLPDFEISGINLFYSSGSYIYVKIDSDLSNFSEDQPRTVVFFWSSSPDVSSQNYTSFRVSRLQSSAGGSVLAFISKYPPFTFPLYIQVYPVSTGFVNNIDDRYSDDFSEAGIFRDPIINKLVFASIGAPSATLRIDAPNP